MATKVQKKSHVSRQSTSLMFKSFHEFVKKENISDLPPSMRGIYALYKEDAGKKNLAYVGMTGNGIKGRLGKHAWSKAEYWTHCSVFEVWDNVARDQIVELEALLRHMLRADATASALNIQKGSAIFRKLAKETRETKKR